MKTNFLRLLGLCLPLILSAQNNSTSEIIPSADPVPLIKAGEVPENLLPCDVYENIACGTSITRTTKNAGNDFVQYSANGLQGYNFSGADQLYRLNVSTQSNLRIVLECLSGTDLDLFLVSTCGGTPTVALYSIEDNRSSGIYREVIDVNSTPGTLFVIVDSGSSVDDGSFKLSVNCNCACAEPLYAQPDGLKMWGDDFEDYQPNVRLAPQSTRWQLWKTASPASADAIVTPEGSGATATKFALFNGTSIAQPDVTYHTSNRTSGRYRLGWRMRVNVGKSGYYNVLHGLPDANGQNAVFAYEVFFDSNGAGRVLVNNGSTSRITIATFAYTPGQWLNVANFIDIEKDLVELWIGDNFVGSWRFSISSPANSPLNKQLAGIDFYAANNTTFAVDNLCIWQKKSTCTVNAIFAPVCTDKGDQYNNSGVARCDLYTSGEYGSCTDVCDYGGTFIDRGQTYSGVLTASDEAPTNLKRSSSTCNALTTSAGIYADIYTFFNDKKKTNGANEDIIISYNSSDPTLRCNVFLCKNPYTCAPLDDPYCLASIPANTSFTINQQGFACDNFYYIVFSGALGATYSNFSIVPDGYCPSGAEVIDFTSSYIGNISSGTGNSRFSKTGDAYKSCYNGTRSYNGAEKVYKFTLTETAKLTFTATSSAQIGMFLYSYICGGTCLGYAENLTAGKAELFTELAPGTYYLVVDRNSTSGNISFNLTPIKNFVIFVVTYCNDETNPEAHQVALSPSAYPFIKDDEVVFLYNDIDNKLKETSVKSWQTFDQPLQFGMTATLLPSPKCGYEVNEPFKVFVNRKTGNNRSFKQMNLVFTPKNTAGNTGEDKFEKAKFSTVAQMTENFVSHFGTETKELSVGGAASTTRIRLSTNKKWKTVIKNSEFYGTPVANPWFTVTPNNATGATVIRIDAVANPTTSARSLYLEIYAEDQPNILKHGIKVTQAPKPTPYIEPDGGSGGIMDISEVSLEATPNPTNGLATLQLELPQPAEVEIRLLDVLGRSVELVQPLQETESRTFALDLSALPNGLYRVVAMVNGQPLHKTLMLQH